MFSRICKSIAAVTASMLVWSNAAATVSALPHISAATVTPPYSCPAVYDAIIAMKEDYPEGMPWTNDDFYAWDGGGMYSGGYGCVAYAYLVSDAAFGTLQCEEPLDYDPALLRVGDMIRYDGHTIVVLEVESDAFIVTEGNFNHSIHWGRRVTFDSLEGLVEYYTSRYPEVFCFREHEAEIEIGATVTPAVISRDAVALTWATSDSTVATVDADGVITGIDNGIATITAEYSGVTESFTVTVGDPSIITEPEIPEGLQYTVNYDNTVIITGYTGTATKLAIPATIDGLPVSRIDFYAFTNAPITEITLPDTITMIGVCAFCNTDLTSIILPDALDTICIGAFIGTKIQSLEIPRNVRNMQPTALIGMTETTAFTVAEENPYYCAVDGVVFDKAMETLIAYPAGKTDTSYTIPDTVTTTEQSAFSGAYLLEEVTIPASLTLIKEAPFSGATALQQITVSEDNTAYCDIDGVLYTADGKSLIAYPTGRSDASYMVANGTESIGIEAFAGSSYLQTVVLPDSLLSIEPGAFAVCTALTDIVIPGNCTTIADYAFDSCISLTSCRIPPSVTSIGEGAFSACADEFTIYGVEGSYAQTYAEENSIPFATITEPAIPEGLTYSINDNNTVTITGYTGTATKLTIPATIEGLPVTAIGALAFHRSILTSITLPDTLTTIGISAFMESSLQSLTLPKNVSEIGNGALIAMKELTAFSVDPENPYFCSVDGVLHTADMTTLVAYPAGKTDAVYTVADGVTQIMALIFTDALYLQEINIPASVTSADMGAFVVATALQNINVDAENTVYCDIDGVLYSADKKTLVAYPYARTATAYVIPDGVETILNTSLNNASLQELTIPASVTVIEHDVYHSENLKKIYGVEGSYAQTYAEENFITFEAVSETVGDINRDNAVTIADAILLSRLIAEDTTLDISPLNMNAVDCNADGIADISDSIWILQSLAGV